MRASFTALNIVSNAHLLNHEWHLKWCDNNVMVSHSLSRVIIDTNVVFEGLTKKGGAAGLIIDAWHAGLVGMSLYPMLSPMSI
jgi:hypothetical protein